MAKCIENWQSECNAPFSCTPDRSRLVAVAAAVNLLAFVPALVPFVMRLLGASATVQFNVGNPAAMELWSAWVGPWPLFMLTLLSCLVVAESQPSPR
jgi:hypothetical protein